MKKTRFILWVALGLGLGTASCGNPDGVGKQQLFSNASHVDNEGFTFFKTVYEKAAFEVELAKHVATTHPGAEATELSNQVIATYEALLPELEEMAGNAQVVLPDPGQPRFEVPASLATDSTNSMDVLAYKNHVAHEQYYLLDQFKRGSRNTYSPIRAFAKEHLDQVKALFVAAGGQEAEGAH